MNLRLRLNPPLSTHNIDRSKPRVRFARPPTLSTPKVYGSHWGSLPCRKMIRVCFLLRPGSFPNCTIVVNTVPSEIPMWRIVFVFRFQFRFRFDLHIRFCFCFRFRFFVLFSCSCSCSCSFPFPFPFPFPFRVRLRFRFRFPRARERRTSTFVDSY